MDFRDYRRIGVDIKGTECKKDCPYILQAEKNRMPLPGTKVGSLLCRRCTYFVMYEPKSKRIVCKFEIVKQESSNATENTVQ